MKPISFSQANQIKAIAMKAGFPAFVIHFGHVKGVYAVQVSSYDISEIMAKANEGIEHNYGFQNIMGGILITTSDIKE